MSEVCKPFLISQQSLCIAHLAYNKAVKDKTRRQKQKSIGLSKSRVMYGLQCPKRLCLHTHDPDLASPVSGVQQAIFDQGTAVGILAQKKIPGRNLNRSRSQRFRASVG